MNLRAEEEARELTEQLETMTAEREDLVSAIAKLRQGIGNLNREGRERMLEAFEKVNANFSRLFTHLFGGGEAYLKLTESDVPLEAGLETMARPPRTRPQVRSLLSRGVPRPAPLPLLFALVHPHTSPTLPPPAFRARAPDSPLPLPPATGTMQQFAHRSGLDKTQDLVEIEKVVVTSARGQVEAWIISALEAVERCRSMEHDKLESKDIEKR